MNTMIDHVRQDHPPLTVAALDVGNAVMTLGVLGIDSPDEAPRLLGKRSYTTPEHITADEAHDIVAQGFACMGAPKPTGAILGCVVPQLTAPLRVALGEACPTRPFVVGPGLKSGVRVRYRNPADLGADRVAAAVGAQALYGAPCITVSLGTTTHIEVVDTSGTFIGGVICPGSALGAEALDRAAARLPMVDLNAPRHVIGQSTQEAIQSGIMLGEAARIDGLLDLIVEELGYQAPIVLTGESADQIERLLRHRTKTQDPLVLIGLAEIWRRNAI